jgi:hypothetical protein
MRLEGLGQFKNSITSSGIERVAFRLVAQRLNQLRYRAPPIVVVVVIAVAVAVEVIHSTLQVLASSKKHVTSELCICTLLKLKLIIEPSRLV